jgi:hypothetical protein
MKFYIAVLFGSVVYLLFQLNGVFSLPDFKWRYFIKTNLIPTILNLVLGCAFVLAKDDLTALYPITFFSAFMLGISGQSIFKKVANMFDKDKPTTFGLNEKDGKQNPDMDKDHVDQG